MVRLSSILGGREGLQVFRNHDVRVDRREDQGLDGQTVRHVADELPKIRDDVCEGGCVGELVPSQRGIVNPFVKHAEVAQEIEEGVLDLSHQTEGKGHREVLVIIGKFPPDAGQPEVIFRFALRIEQLDDRPDQDYLFDENAGVVVLCHESPIRAIKQPS